MQKLYRLSTIFVGLLLFLAPIKVLAHAGHGNEFHSDTAQQSADAIQVDAETAKRLGIKVVPVAKQQLAIGIKTTGQIEALPNQKVEVTAPVDGSVVELLVKPGDRILKNQPVAVITSGELAQLRVESAEKRATAQGDIQQAQADLQLAQENLQRQREIAIAEIEQAQTELKVAQEQYDKDRDLVKVGALPRRQMLESQAHLAEAKAQLAKANSRKEVIEAENQVKRAKSALEVAKSRLNLSSAAYQTRLQQLGSIANQKGLVTVLAPISGTVA
ncbi:MAG TPA: efflux RND transporter periplasmic adaptor subunit, partial [Nostocaceae cyanobacterium]|nr:efflux RND transporter periplasmic adaptor subunit [Nostocaceae cyanobacterium]